MADEQRANGSGGAEGGPVKVNDRRRFTPEGDPIPTAGDQAATDDEGAAAPVEAQPDERDATIARQQARIDELMRAFAATVEEGKAARGRMEREKTRVLESERAQIAQALLEAVDHLELAMGAAGDARGPVVDGVRLTLSSLAKKVSELGAERIAVLGQPFDPRVAEAVDLVPVTDPAQDEVVVQEVRAGYRIGDRVLRPARVRVGRLARA
jgi:molecular chaperone GrpE